MIFYFFEYVPLKFFFNFSDKILALNPNVCYLLDKKRINYFIPEDFTYPKRLPEDQIRQRLERLKKRNWQVFLQEDIQIIEADMFYDDLLSIILKSKNIKQVRYFGNNILPLIKQLEIKMEIIYERESTKFYQN